MAAQIRTLREKRATFSPVAGVRPSKNAWPAQIFRPKSPGRPVSCTGGAFVAILISENKPRLSCRTKMRKQNGRPLVLTVGVDDSPAKTPRSPIDSFMGDRFLQNGDRDDFDICTFKKV
jgi:hypothetical protein